MPGKSKFQISRSLDERIKRIINGSNEYDSEFSHASSAYILGFNYGNITNCLGLTTNYQLNHAVFPVVGLVFFKNAPTDDEVKASLKRIREYSSSPNGLGSFKQDKNEHLFLIYSVDDGTGQIDKRIFNFTKGSFVRRKRLRLNVLDDPYYPRQVHKGSEDLYNLGDGDSTSSSDDDQVDHLIFFIHGVGGVCDVRFRSCAEVVADFKKLANNLLAQQSNPSSGASTPSNKYLAQQFRKGFIRKHSSESNASHTSDISENTKANVTKAGKIECLPISWHSCTRRQIGMNDQLNLIALSSVPKLRQFLNKVVMDALLYSSGPVYSQTIINNVGDEINRLYSLFMEKHPNFKGSVSLAGHSLGSVIVFDLLAHQIPTDSSTDTCNINNNNNGDNDGSGNNNNHSEKNIDSKETNARLACGNVSHHHHDIKSDSSGCCTNYKNLEELLKDMNLTQYAELFHKEHIDIKTLLLLTDLDLRELNLPLGARRKLGTYINFKKVSSASEVHQSYGALPGQQQCQPPDNLRRLDESSPLDMNTGQYLIKYPQLKFKPKCFFAFGSPMPMFLNIRGIQEISSEYKLPTCERMLNIFHPYDPLAYRLEPLIDARFRNIGPIQIPHYRGGKRIHVQLRESFSKVGYDLKHRLFGSLKSTWSSFTRFGSVDQDSPSGSSSGESVPTEARKRFTKSASSSVEVEVESFESLPSGSGVVSGASEVIGGSMQKRKLKRQDLIRSQSDAQPKVNHDKKKEHSDLETDRTETSPSFLERMKSLNFGNENDSTTDQEIASTFFAERKKGKQKKRKNKNKNKDKCEDQAEFDSSRVGKLNGGRRLDFVLQEKPIELFNEYIFAFISHASYWQNEDSALIVLNEIYQNGDFSQIFDLFD